MNRSGIYLIFGTEGTTVFDEDDRDVGLRDLVEEQIKVAIETGAFCCDQLGPVADCLRASAIEMRALADLLDEAADGQAASV